MKSATDYAGKGGFIDIPRILTDDVEREIYPELLPNVHEIRQADFPLFEKFNRVYLDNAATTQVPKSVKERMHEYSVGHIRGSSHSNNSEEAREAHKMFDKTRKNLEDFFNAHNYAVGLTSGTTGTSNYIVERFPFERDDTLLITEMEHNSQILTARNMARSAGAKVEYVPVKLPEGRLDLEQLESIVQKQKKGKVLLNLVHASNVTGIVNPVREIREIVGNRGFIYLDLAQSAGHMPIDLGKLDVDAAGASAHKMFGPTGIGAIFVNRRSEDHVTNKVSGGSAVRLVSKHFDVPANSPARLEPGTQDLEGAIEWDYTLDYLKQIGMDKIADHDKELGKYFVGELQKINKVRIYGPTEFKDRISVVAFNVDSFRKKNYDEVAKRLDQKGISIRDGCFCAHIYTAKVLGLPSFIHEGRTALMKVGISEDLIKLPGAVRASFAFYNNLEDAYKTVNAIRDISK